MKVTDPSGQTWRISRRWVPWARRDALNLDEGPGDGPRDVLLVMALVVMLFFIPIVLLALFVAGQVLLLLFVLPLVALARLSFGQRWQVEVRRDWTPWAEFDAGGWRRSGQLIEELAGTVRRGEVPTRTLGTDPPA